MVSKCKMTCKLRLGIWNSIKKIAIDIAQYWGDLVLWWWWTWETHFPFVKGNKGSCSLNSSLFYCVWISRLSSTLPPKNTTASCPALQCCPTLKTNFVLVQSISIGSDKCYLSSSVPLQITNANITSLCIDTELRRKTGWTGKFGMECYYTKQNLSTQRCSAVLRDTQQCL